ncbi:hypothetical protein [Streptomyces marincola]|uniref:Uncharacterized protein n=1 Tax=Streptomyces marincola TaxID=2878388 RepID=A0A1W7CYX6_9ACTN|nr:hypothetical protein [Streptomyces marincola]ARQ69869.1 hypothetical protein CAG99_14230 [Streptomyces marincola]
MTRDVHDVQALGGFGERLRRLEGLEGLREQGEQEEGALDALGAVPPPVDAVVRRGRVMRRRRRVALLGAAVAAAAALPLLPAVLPSADQGRGPTPPAAGPPAVREVREVRPRQPVDIGRGLRMGLLPEEDRGHVVAPEAAFQAEIADAESRIARGGASEPPGGLTLSCREAGGALVCTGTWHTGAEPARVTVRAADGRAAEAYLLTLDGRPGWGGYHADLGEGPAGEQVTVTARDAAGAVIAETQVAPGPG